MRLPERLSRLLLPRSLRWQFILALFALALLMTAGSFTAVYALRLSADTTRQLAGERLMRMQDAQDMMERTFLIERQTRQLGFVDSPQALRSAYEDILKELETLDQLVERLGQSDEDVSILALHESAQLFRNTANIVAGLQDGALQVGQEPQTLRSEASQANLRRFHAELQRQAVSMVEAARLVSEHLTEDYQTAVQGLAKSSSRNQAGVLILLGGSLVLAWLVSHYFLGRRVVARLQQVSHALRHGTAEDQRLPVQGSDEISDMARAVEQFLKDRQQLAEAHTALEAERARQEELIKKLAEAQNQLLQSEKLASLGQLAAGVAHEINNPVGFVNSNLNTLQRNLADLFQLITDYEASEHELKDETRGALAELKKTIDLAYLREDVASLLAESMDGLQRVKRIVQDLKDFSHVDESEMQWANLERGLDSTINVAWNEIKYKADVVKEYGAIPDVRCMPSQLNQVFLNLLVNAAHAIKDHGRITVRTGQDGDQVWVEVEDTGCGIRPEHLGRIFDPFFTTKPVGQGTGLGLSLSYGIVQKHGGRIEVKSEMGVGTTFRVVLPIQAQPAPTPAP